jgi:regulatory protein
VDGEPVARLSIQGIERLGLRPGLDLDEPLAAAVGAEATVSRTYDRAMAMLAARGRASGELRRLLIRKGENHAVVDEVMHRLTVAGFLDDASFARQFTRWKSGAAGLSRRRIEQELGRRGVDRQTAAAAIAETFLEEHVDERAAIQLAAEKKLRTLTRVDDLTRRRRLYAFLARRGYDADVITETVSRLTRKTGEPAD